MHVDTARVGQVRFPLVYASSRREGGTSLFRDTLRDYKNARIGVKHIATGTTIRDRAAVALQSFSRTALTAFEHLEPPENRRRFEMFKGRQFDQSVILLCVRWYLAYNLSLRDLKKMMAERGIDVDHSTIHRWVVHFAPQLLERFNRRKPAVTGKWHVDETYIKIRGEWMYLYRAIDGVGDTVEFWFSKHRDLPADSCSASARRLPPRPE
jgi:hypothetical protein